MELADLPAFWSKEEQEWLQDPFLVEELGDYRKEVEKAWKCVKNVMKSCPKHFDLSSITKQHWLNAYNLVVTRCFGWGLPSTMMVPLADAFNHTCCDVQFDVYSRNNPNLNSKINFTKVLGEDAIKGELEELDTIYFTKRERLNRLNDKIKEN